MHYFYEASLEGGMKDFELSKEESQHAVKVLRLQMGDKVHVLNGRGCLFHAVLDNPNPKGCSLIIETEEFQTQPKPSIHIALALLKKRDRIEWFLEKAVECGASSISIFSSRNTEKKGWQKERFDKILISALKQSGNYWLPELHGLIPFNDLIKNTEESQKYIAYCPVETTQHLKHIYPPGENAIILIGPEGDFSEEEVLQAKEKGFTEVSLGGTRLRAETAAIYSLIALRLENEG